jgi:hypothetical protein
MGSKKDQMLRIRVTPELRTALESEARRLLRGGVSISALCRDILTKWAEQKQLIAAEPPGRYDRPKKSQRSASSGEGLRRGGGT